MTKPSITFSTGIRSIQINKFSFMLIVFIAITFGTLIPFTSPTFVLLSASSIITFIIWLFWPNLLLIPFILFSMYVPNLPLIDLGFLTIVARSIFTLTKDKRWPLLTTSNFIKPCVALIIITTLSTLYGLTIAQNHIPFIYRDLRVFIYWMMVLPLIAWSPKENPDKWIVKTMLITAFVVSILAIFQGITGHQIVGTGLVADLNTMNQDRISTVRVQIPGFIFVAFGVCYLMSSILIKNKLNSYNFILLAIFITALIFNFGRALWAWTTIAIVIISILSKLRGVIRLWLIGGLVLSLFITLLTILKPSLLEPVTNRIISVQAEGGRGTSFGWREMENEVAIKKLQQTFLLGVGMGGQYRSPVRALLLYEDHTRYLHNGLIFLILKLSGFGLIIYASIFWKTLVNLCSMPNSEDNNSIRNAIIGFLIAYLGLNLTQPEIMTHYGLLPIIFIVSLTLLKKT